MGALGFLASLWAMEYFEHIQLRQHYQAALRRCEQALLPSGEPNRTTARLAAEIMQKALQERNEAGNRMFSHRRTCPVCTRNLKVVHSPGRA
jgi:hypothetical protein